MTCRIKTDAIKGIFNRLASSYMAVGRHWDPSEALNQELRCRMNVQNPELTLFFLAHVQSVWLPEGFVHLFSWFSVYVCVCVCGPVVYARAWGIVLMWQVLPYCFTRQDVMLWRCLVEGSGPEMVGQRLAKCFRLLFNTQTRRMRTSVEGVKSLGTLPIKWPSLFVPCGDYWTKTTIFQPLRNVYRSFRFTAAPSSLLFFCGTGNLIADQGSCFQKPFLLAEKRSQ